MKLILSATIVFIATTSFRTEEVIVAAHTKRALIIAIGAYDKRETGWGPLSSENDAVRITDALIQIGFDKRNISQIKDEKATKAGILEALKMLETQAQTGDYVVIHYSGHGQQIYDDNGDEIDGLDETLVAFGSINFDVKKKDSRGVKLVKDFTPYLRDEAFGAAIQDIRVKVGIEGHVLVIMDSCHSGSGTRGDAIVRGGTEPMGPDGWTKPVLTGKEDESGFGLMNDAPKTRGELPMGKFVLISGAGAAELNSEYYDEDAKIGYGSLSFSISKVLQNLPPGTTYRTLFAKVQSEMADKAPRQSPQLEGDGIDFEIFGGTFIPQQKYYSVSTIVNDKVLKINGGTLMQILPGAEIVVEASGTTKPQGKEKALSSGRVVKVTQLSAEVTLDRPIDASKKKASYWVFITTPAVAERKVRVDVSKLTNAPLRKSITDELTKLDIAEITPSKADLAIKEEGSGSAALYSVINLEFGQPVNAKGYKGDDPATAKNITKDIQNYVQGKLFKALDIENPLYDVVITRLIPSKSKKIEDTLDYQQLVSRGSVVQVTSSEDVAERPYVFIEMRNNTDSVRYFNIIDIEATGAINPVFPPRIRDSNGAFVGVEDKEVFRLRPNQTRVFNYPVRISPPYGVDLFKVIASKVPFDITSTIISRGERTRGASLNSFQRKLGNSFESGASRGEPVESDIGTSEFKFEIIRRK